MGPCMGSYRKVDIMPRAFFSSLAFPLEHCDQTDLKCLQTKDKSCVPPHILKSKS